MLHKEAQEEMRIEVSTTTVASNHSQHIKQIEVYVDPYFEYKALALSASAYNKLLISEIYKVNRL
jgi:hypothetical protein